jgi:hypothetical protein
MGPYLTVPKKDKDSVDGENSSVCLHSFTSLHYDVFTLLYYVDEIRSNRNARLEKYNGGLTHCSP